MTEMSSLSTSSKQIHITLVMLGHGSWRCGFYSMYRPKAHLPPSPSSIAWYQHKLRSKRQVWKIYFFTNSPPKEFTKYQSNTSTWSLPNTFIGLNKLRHLVSFMYKAIQENVLTKKCAVPHKLLQICWEQIASCVKLSFQICIWHTPQVTCATHCWWPLQRTCVHAQQQSAQIWHFLSFPD